MAMISVSGESTVQESNYSEKTSISRDEFAEDSLKIVLENDDSVGEISLKKQVISSISEKDEEMIRSTSTEVSVSENEVMKNTEILSLLETNSMFLEEEKIGGDLQEFKETYAANVSLSEVSKEDDRFGDHKIEDTDAVIDSISEVQGSEVEQCNFVSNGKDHLKPEKKVQDSDSQRVLEEAERRRLLTIFKKRVDVETRVEAYKIGNNENCSRKQHEKLERVGVKDNGFVGRSVPMELIDDTALVDVVAFIKKAKDYPKRQVTGNAPRKYKKVGEKPIDKGNASNGKKLRIMYTGKEMESMRYANMENQKKLWSDLYASLLPEVVKEYEGLVSLKNQKSSKTNLRENGFGILGPISAVPRRNRVNNVFVH